jgi:hypothetical protein
MATTGSAVALHFTARMSASWSDGLSCLRPTVDGKRARQAVIWLRTSRLLEVGGLSLQHHFLVWRVCTSSLCSRY